MSGLARRVKPWLRRHGPLLLLMGLLVVVGGACAVTGPNGQPAGVPKIGVSVDPSTSDKTQLASTLQLFIMLTVLSVLPSILLLMTPFTSIVIVLSLTRSAIGIPTLPPNQVIVGLALFLTFFVSQPTWDLVKKNALDPFFRDEITLEVAQDRALEPVRAFMFRRTSQEHLAIFLNYANLPQPKTEADVPTTAIIPAFIISEMQTGFRQAFVLFLPFVLIDIVVAMILVGLGMQLVSPATISLPFKLMFFVLLDGWALIVQNILAGFTR